MEGWVEKDHQHFLQENNLFHLIYSRCGARIQGTILLFPTLVLLKSARRCALWFGTPVATGCLHDKVVVPLYAAAERTLRPVREKRGLKKEIQWRVLLCVLPSSRPRSTTHRIRSWKPCICGSPSRDPMAFFVVTTPSPVWCSRKCLSNKSVTHVWFVW